MRCIRNGILIWFVIFPAIANMFGGEFDSILRWRNVGPYRGGRTHAICGVPSQPNVFYMAPVNGGVFKSTDYGRTWLPIFDDQPTASVGTIAVSISNTDIVFVAASGHPYGPNEERGVYRSIDGGKTFEKVLYRDENVGASDVLIDPSDPSIVYASLWESRDGPWENGVFNGDGAGIFKSIDG